MNLAQQMIWSMGILSLVGCFTLGTEGFGFLGVIIHDLKKIWRQKVLKCK
jgi:hypothetical protein